MSLTLVINGTVTQLPTDKAWSLSYAPDAPKPAPVTDLAAAIAAAKPGDRIILDKNIAYNSKAIRVTTPDLTIEGNDARISFDQQGAKDAALFVLDGVKGFTLSDVTVSGPAKSSAASYVVRCENAACVKLSKVKTVASYSGGMGVVFCRGVDVLNVDACSTERTTVYSMYCSAPGGALINQNINVRRCVWGPSESHNMRVYGVKNLVIEESMFNNPRSPSGRQCIKVMNGENVSIKRTDFDGTTRFGRDVNDPSSYSLKNCTIEDCNFTDWARVDPTGGNPVTYRRCKVRSQGDSFVFHLFDRTVLEDVDATYVGAGGRLANSSKLIVSQKNVTFNGKAV